jgi:hypothetical protein
MNGESDCPKGGGGLVVERLQVSIANGVIRLAALLFAPFAVLFRRVPVRLGRLVFELTSV